MGVGLCVLECVLGEYAFPPAARFFDVLECTKTLSSHVKAVPVSDDLKDLLQERELLYEFPCSSPTRGFRTSELLRRGFPSSRLSLSGVHGSDTYHPNFTIHLQLDTSNIIVLQRVLLETRCLSHPIGTSIELPLPPFRSHTAVVRKSHPHTHHHSCPLPSIPPHCPERIRCDSFVPCSPSSFVPHLVLWDHVLSGGTTGV